MKKEKIKNISLLIIGLIGLVTTLIINNLVENDILCIIIMLLFLSLEIFALFNIIKDKYPVM